MAPYAPDVFDVLVIGAGFGGLGAALALAERGARVCVCETLRYPGGCASTFSRDGFRFDAGATLVSGLGPGQFFGAWLARYAPDLELEWMDPLVELRTPDLRLAVTRDRDELVRDLCARPGAPAAGIRAFFLGQRRVADVLWALFDDPALLPPFRAATLARHVTRGLRYAPLLGLMGRTLGSVLASYGLADFEPLRIYADALCQITVQCPAAEAEAPFALAAMDYYHRGTAHVLGGVGALATALLHASQRLGAHIRLAAAVRALRYEGGHPDGGWIVTTRRGDVRARAVVANLLPSALGTLLGGPRALPSPMTTLGARVDEGWGAAMLYAVARAPAGASQEAHHLELVRDPSRPFTDGNHLFASLSSARETERAPPGRRTITISTHVAMPSTRGEGARAFIDAVHARMRETFAALAPEWSTGIERVLTASPRTFARFVGRPGGAVGGLPRRAGLSNYGALGPVEVQRGLWLAGDSVFPGQSALATAIGGARTAEAIARRLGTRAA